MKRLQNVRNVFKTYRQVRGNFDGTQARTTHVPVPVASEKVHKLAEEILCLNLIEGKALSDLIKERLGIPKDQQMAAPMMHTPVPMAPVSQPVSDAPKEEEAAKETAKAFFDIKLEKIDEANKVKIIKEIRAVTPLSLKEVKDMVEKLPSFIKKKSPKDEAETLKTVIEGLGGVVKLV
jgi:large subunit ribosomal protein L7/L12